jgi:circadian clock protein KaiC
MTNDERKRTNGTSRNARRKSLRKTLTGIEGLDEVTQGGLPTGRTTLVCGGAGSGKTVLSMEFLVRGIVDKNEAGVFVAFEETATELEQNMASMGFDLQQFQSEGKLLLDYVELERSQIEETGAYDLEGLFIRLADSIDSIKAKRVVLDTIEILFAGLKDEAIIRAELRRLFRWLKDKGVTAIVTGEKGDGTLTRYGLEEYVADCVIVLDHRVTDQLSTRRMRIVKYRGTMHGTDEYPFLMTERGVSVLPITSLGLEHGASTDKISSGISGLDDMLCGDGFFRGSSILVSGTAGTGKSSMGSAFLQAACIRGETSVYFAFEESSQQILRNMRSIGIDLQPWIKKKRLHICSTRPSSLGLEGHLESIHRTIAQMQPTVILVDPITNLIGVTNRHDIKSMLTRLIDYVKTKDITAMFTHLSSAGHGGTLESSDEGVSSLMDAWILLRDSEHNDRRSYGIYVLKARGMAHSHEIRRFRLTGSGIEVDEPIAMNSAREPVGSTSRVPSGSSIGATLGE